MEHEAGIIAFQPGPSSSGSSDILALYNKALIAFHNYRYVCLRVPVTRKAKDKIFYVGADWVVKSF
jgi:hypothetical protein